jgi:predicted lipid-binding transport protein (Tim44 family)
MRLIRAFSASVLAALIAAGTALGQAGGGSSDYGGGGGWSGGGGGGGWDSGGFDSGGGGSFGEGDGGWGFLVLVGIVIVIGLATALVPIVTELVAKVGDVVARPLSAVGRWRRRDRVRAVELAAVEAATDDERFAAERVRSDAEALFRDVQAAWDRNDTDRLRQLLAPELMAEWERRLADFTAKGWNPRADVLGKVEVEYVGLANQEGESEDRAVVLIEAMLRAFVLDKNGNVVLRKGEANDTIWLSQYWTLGIRDGRWTLHSIEESEEGSHNLTDPIVAAPWIDTERLRDDAVLETATADGLPAGFSPADLPDLDYASDAHASALDLSLADPRFSPDVLAAPARQAVAAWAEAVDGEDAALARLATEPALEQLLHEGDAGRKRRVVVRGPRVERITVVALDAAAEPATMTVEVEVEGRRYVQDRDTAAVLSGSRDEAATFTERWTFALDGTVPSPWRITAVGEGARPTGER